MTITTESGNYAVRKADIIVITLDSEWKTGSVKSGIESLRDFDLTDKKRQQLEKKIREYYTG